jgi:predicted PurR-regulated permease PerM
MRLTSIQNGLLIGLLFVATCGFLWLVLDFLLPVFWAVLLALVFQPAFRRFNTLLGGRRSLSSLLTVLLTVLVVMIPLLLVGLAVVHESLGLYQRIATGQIDFQPLIDFFDRYLPVVTDYLERYGLPVERVNQGLSSAAMTASQFAASQLVSAGQNTVRFVVLSAIMLYLLFFFLRDGDRLVDGLIRTIPLGDARERFLFDRFAEVSLATIKGTFVVGIVQGFLGGLLFWLLGLDAAVFWGVIMTLLSFLPAIGSAVVWAPAALILIVSGSVVKGVVLFLAGAVIIGLADNLLRPLLVGRETRLPDYLILLSTLGGLTAFGIAGFVIGPVIAALFLAAWELFRQEYEGMDRSEPPGAPQEGTQQSTEAGGPGEAE